MWKALSVCVFSDKTTSLAVIYQCGGCTWSIESASGALQLRMTGPPDCGIGCPAVLDMSSQDITSIEAGAFNTTGLQNVTDL